MLHIISISLPKDAVNKMAALAPRVSATSTIKSICSCIVSGYITQAVLLGQRANVSQNLLLLIFAKGFLCRHFSLSLRNHFKELVIRFLSNFLGG